jgi:serine/threonine-protein phosphatase CPPED1
MKPVKIIIAVFLLSLITGMANAQKNDNIKPYFFIQITDPQFGFFEDNKGFSKETELYEKAVNAINRLNPDFVVITGDLVNNKDDNSQKAEFKRITAIINKKIPVYYSPGNHDIGLPPTRQDIDSFISDYGHDKFSFQHKKSIFIGLNSCIIKANSPVLEQGQFDWLSKELVKTGSAEHIILFCHIPFFINSFEEPESYSNIPIETRNKYFSLFKEYKVEAIFAGHLHSNSSAKYGNTSMVTTSALGKPLGDSPSGIRIIIVYPERIESFYYSIYEIPETIVLKGN